MRINIKRINDDKEWMKKIIFKWDREWDRESVGSVFEKVDS